MILSAIVDAILVATGIVGGGIRPGEAGEAGMGVVIGLVLAYLWGGYTAGRMARGSGAAIGILIPIVALVAVAILGTVIAAVNGGVNEFSRAISQQLPLPLSRLDRGTAVGVGLLLGMLGGGSWARLGARWHTNLENKA